MLLPGPGQKLLLGPGNLRRLPHIFIDFVYFFFLDLNVQAAHQVNGVHQGLEIYGNIIFYIQIQVLVQHIDGFFGASMEVCVIRLIIFHVHLLQDRIPVDGSHPDLFGLIINRCDNNGIRVSSFFQMSVSGVSSKQGYRCISFLLSALIDLNVFRINGDRLEFLIFGHYVSCSHQHHQDDDLKCKEERPLPSPAPSFLPELRCLYCFQLPLSFRHDQPLFSMVYKNIYNILLYSPQKSNLS